LRRQGLDDHAATKQLEGVSVAARNELLFTHGINFNELPTWHRRGIGLYARDQETTGVDPRDGSAVTLTRRVVVTDLELPMKDAYDAFVRAIVTAQGASAPRRT
jgi:tRNA(His) 5'-end guanylyltransferase